MALQVKLLRVIQERKSAHRRFDSDTVSGSLDLRDHVTYA